MARLAKAVGDACTQMTNKLRHREGKSDGTSSEHAGQRSAATSQPTEVSETRMKPDQIITAMLDNDPAFHPQVAFEQPPATVDSVMDKTTHALKTAAKAARHPITTAKQKTSKILALQEAPYLSEEADQTFAHALAKLDEAEGAQGEDGNAEETLTRLRADVDGLEETRSSMKAAWITSRFVHRAGVVRAEPYGSPNRRDPQYWKLDGDGQGKSFRYELYLAHRLRYDHQSYNTQYFPDVDEVPFDKDLMLLHLERLIVASGPWQAWLVRLRNLSRWEDPNESAKWFAIWILIWLSNRVISFVLLWVIYITLKHRMVPASQGSFRESYKRAVDRSTSAFKFKELIGRRGEARWLEPLIEKCGPILQIQMSDTADQLEVMNNFYDWANPSTTMATVAYFMTAVIFGNVTSTDFVMRSVTSLIIGYFFLSRPIASWHPKYRHMVTPLKWVFWDIPTQAEWSFRYLQAKAKAISQSGNGSTATPSIEPVLRSYFCFRHGTPGKLSITASHLTFVSSLGSQAELQWSLPELEQLRKLDRHATRSLTKLRSPRSLQITFVDESVEVFEGMRRRDEAFNTIIGFSNFMWKQLPSLPRDHSEILVAESAELDNRTVDHGSVDVAEEAEEWFDARP